MRADTIHTMGFRRVVIDGAGIGLPHQLPIRKRPFGFFCVAFFVFNLELQVYIPEGEGMVWIIPSLGLHILEFGGDDACPLRLAEIQEALRPDDIRHVCTQIAPQRGRPLLRG